MSKKIAYILIAIILLVLIVGLFLYLNQKYQVISTQPSKPNFQAQNQGKLDVLPKISVLVDPIAQFQERITKKPFGIYITPQTSPIQPERFSGYHTGLDVEYDDSLSDVPVYALYDGRVILSQQVSGYGGTIVLQTNINGENLYIFYGHLNPSNLIPVGSDVKKGQQIAILGKGYSQETDGERKHLHFAIRKNNLDLRGYVQNQSELSDWYNPVDFYKQINQN
jgi:murein DD-endopeptidase MepM/ murein hydrolase activator NlpD